MPHPLDAHTVRTWCAEALEDLGQARETIDALNVYPVADADTGTNLYLTMESAAQAVEAAWAGEPTAFEALGAMAHGALIGAHGNSGTILAQLLRGVARADADGGTLADALAGAARAAAAAVAHPVGGTILSVAEAAAEAAAEAQAAAHAEAEAQAVVGRPADRGGRAGDRVVRAAFEGARTALDATPGQLDVLARAGVVDAGGYGLVVVLGALVKAVTGNRPDGPVTHHVSCPGHRQDTAAEPTGPRSGGGGAAVSGPAYEVIYLLDASDEALERLRGRLDALGDSLVIIGGDGLWNVHVHVDDAGAAIEAGVEAGRPHRIRVTHFEGVGAAVEPVERAVVAVVPGEGLAALCSEAGATVVTMGPEEPPSSGELAAAIGRAHAREVVLLPGSSELRHTAAAAAEQVRAEGVRVAIVPTRSAVQGLAALAVHEPGRRFEEDVVAMTAAAGATRFGELAVAERESWTTAGVCQAGDVLGLIDGDVAVIGAELAATAGETLERMLASGGELVTLVLGRDTPESLAAELAKRARTGHLGVDTVVYHGRQFAPLLIGVE
ncbi:DAK2 domain-containing protein [Streptomyces sp. XM4193]|uniref:DAK2 domain-containing protein n=1 Tax=Streptomyces sp. XM4193 TaxID=2929782 RepID=UPI001FF7DB9A|nr:DAK2 domain-containing protein [Streptomyces sp. XM4193]MCK1798808.1 DAK2 domain-containing protein [Streptomyces sp. XM4193]